MADFASAACPVWSDRESRVFVEVSQTATDPLDLWSVALDEKRHRRTGGAAAMLDRSQLKLLYRDCSFTWTGNAPVISAMQPDTQNRWRLPVSGTGEVSGSLVHLTFGSAREVLPVAAATGAIAFASRAETSGIWQMAIADPDRPIRIADGEFPAVADRRVGYLARSGGRTDVWMKELPAGKETQVTRAPAHPRYPQICRGFRATSCAQIAVRQMQPGVAVYRT